MNTVNCNTVLQYPTVYSTVPNKTTLRKNRAINRVRSVALAVFYCTVLYGVIDRNARATAQLYDQWNGTVAAVSIATTYWLYAVLYRALLDTTVRHCFLVFLLIYKFGHLRSYVLLYHTVVTETFAVRVEVTLFNLANLRSTSTTVILAAWQRINLSRS